MEMTIFKCCEQEPREYEIDRRARYDTYELKGKSRQFVIHDDCATIKVGRNYFYLKNDDVAKIASEKHKDGDSLTITVWKDEREFDFAAAVSVVNHTQNFAVVNHKLSRVMEIQRETKARHERHHNVLKGVMHGGNHIFMLAKKLHNVDGYNYEFVAACNEHQQGKDSKQNMSELLNNAGIVDRDALEKTYLGLGKFNQIYGHGDYALGIFRITEKNQPCAHCDKQSWNDDSRNHSIVVGWGSYREMYYCEYCFFDNNYIRVPQHIVDAANEHN